MNKSELEQTFYYKNNELYRVKDDKLAGNVNSRGYRRVYFKNKYRAVHRIVFLLHHGYLPKYIDHIDGNPLNNNINNLRPATISTNGMNRKLNKNNKLNVKNVCWDKHKSAWKVQVKANKKLVYSRDFRDFELAELVAHEARDKFHKDFARNA